MKNSRKINQMKMELTNTGEGFNQIWVTDIFHPETQECAFKSSMVKKKIREKAQKGCYRVTDQ